jgi:hypothetical protein
MCPRQGAVPPGPPFAPLAGGYRDWGRALSTFSLMKGGRGRPLAREAKEECPANLGHTQALFLLAFFMLS